VSIPRAERWPLEPERNAWRGEQSGAPGLKTSAQRGALRPGAVDGTRGG
jgi:hypothetical protein